MRFDVAIPALVLLGFCLPLSAQSPQSLNSKTERLVEQIANATGAQEAERGYARLLKNADSKFLQLLQKDWNLPLPFRRT